MKKFFKFLAVYLTAMLLFYLIGSFVATDLNPVEWDIIGRASYAIIGSIIAAVLSAAVNGFLE